ncbi:MAG TPA: SDR family oxidoreductase [Xanthobacteraceae bacterium]|jgi:NAD(P)-dependent dehydrogenase (short-subunit alcohol dehydrogenase family)
MPAQKIALVTGAGSGVGRSAALALAREGYAMVLAGRKAENLQAVAKEAASKTLVVPTDVREAAAIQALFAKTKEAFGRLDLLFNNAGVGMRGMPLEDIPLERWLSVVATNLTGPFLCTQEAIKIMKAQNPRGGRIINNGSISAHTPRPGTAAYTATKHAITGLTKQTSLDCRGYDICCGQIDIGNAATPLTEKMAEGMPQADGRVMPEARMDVDDVGRAVVYMASLPLDANVLFMTVMANKMPFVGRG